MRGLSRNMHAFVQWQDMRVGLVAEDVSWSPDVASDMANRLHEMWHNCLLELYRFGMLDSNLDGFEEDDEDEYGPSPERELQDPHTVRLDDGSDDA